jgi:hypothetical protein
VLKFCPFLADQLSRVNEMVIFLRKKNIRSPIALMCPTTVNTRWVVIVRVLQWLIVHYPHFSTVIDESFISLNELKMLFLFFLPLFILVCVFERDNSSVEMVCPLIVSAVRFYFRMEQVPSISTNYDLLHSVRCLSFFLLRRTLDSVNKTRFILSFMLSPLGRSCHRFVSIFFCVSLFVTFIRNGSLCGAPEGDIEAVTAEYEHYNQLFNRVVLASPLAIVSPGSPVRVESEEEVEGGDGDLETVVKEEEVEEGEEVDEADAIMKNKRQHRSNDSQIVSKGFFFFSFVLLFCSHVFSFPSFFGFERIFFFLF